MKSIYVIFLSILLVGCLAIEPVEIGKTESDVKYSGLRSSSYGIEPFPHPKGWGHAFNKIESYFPESQACGIWIISNIDTTNSNCILEFPKNDGDSKEYEGMVFSTKDKHEEYLTYFDQNNIKVFLQVESGKADMEDLIDIILTRYGHHPSVVGFGVDLEWYDPLGNVGMNGETFFTPLNTKTAEEWDRQLKSYNPEYRLFLKHWLHTPDIMPQFTQSDIIFINDAQDFSNLTGGDPKKAINLMVENFSNWAQHFRRDGYIRSVGYQIGYDSDRNFWQDILSAPHPQSYAKKILNEIPKEQEVSIFWVDFSMNDVFMYDYTGPLPVDPIDLPELGENFALNSKIKVSSIENNESSLGGSMLVDNNLYSRWASIASDTEWIEMELDREREIESLVLFWETAYAKSYIVESSLNGIDWEEVFNETDGDGGEDFIDIKTTAKFLRIKSLERGTEWGISLYEVGVYGTDYNI